MLTPGTNRAADAPPRLNSHARGFRELQGQWRIQGRGPGGPRPPYFSPKIRPEGGKKNFLETAPPPPLISGSQASPQNKSTASMRVRRRECMPAGC